MGTGMADFKIRPLAPGFGAEVIGLDLRVPLDADVVRTLRETWLDAGVLVVRGQEHLRPEHQIAFSAHFGEVSRNTSKALESYRLKDHPEIYCVSNKKKDGAAVGREDAGTYWHADGTHGNNPSRGSTLFAVEIPPVGGDTIFANMYGAYESLSDRMKQLLEGLTAYHSLVPAVLHTSYAKEYVGNIAEAAEKFAVHPVVCTHPDSGRKYLYVNPGFTAHIIELPRTEGDAILQFLFDHSTRQENLYRHSWRPHDLVMWDNLGTMHYAVADYKAHGDRLMHRTSIKAAKKGTAQA